MPAQRSADPLHDEHVDFPLQDQISDGALAVGAEHQFSRIGTSGFSALYGRPLQGASSRMSSTSAYPGSASVGNAASWSTTTLSVMMRYTYRPSRRLISTLTSSIGTASGFCRVRRISAALSSIRRCAAGPCRWVSHAMRW